MKNAQFILPILILLLAGSIYYAWQSEFDGNIGARPETEARLAGIPIQGQAVASGRLDFSGGEQREFKSPRRDLFGLLFPAPAPVKIKTLPPKPQPVVPVVQVVQPPPPPIPVRSTVKRMPAFQTLGFLSRNDRITAFISLQGEIYLVKQGETIAGEYVVSELTPSMIKISRSEGEGEVTLPLSEQSGSAAKTVMPRATTVRPVNMPGLPRQHPPLNGVN